MANLISNVYIDGVGYGPDLGNADQVPADVAARIGPHAWDDAPDKDSVPSSTDTGPGDTTAGDPVPEGSDGVPVTNPGTPEPDGRHSERDLLVELAAVPDDKGTLIAFRDAHGLDHIDGRLGVEKLRQALADAIAAR